jgi:hypothetical protein
MQLATICELCSKDQPVQGSICGKYIVGNYNLSLQGPELVLGSQNELLRG